MKTPISREDIRKGDLIRKEYTEPFNSTVAHEYYAQCDGDTATDIRCINYLIDRPLVLPTKPMSVVRIRTNEGFSAWLCLRARDDWDVIDNNGDFHPRVPDPLKLIADHAHTPFKVTILEEVP